MSSIDTLKDAQIAMLQKELGETWAAYHKERDRLDWLEAWQQLKPNAPGYGDPGLACINRVSDGWRLDSEFGIGDTFDTLREAIDKASSMNLIETGVSK